MSNTWSSHSGRTGGSQAAASTIYDISFDDILSHASIASEPDLYASEAIARPKMYNTWPRSGRTGGTQGARSTSHDVFSYDVPSHATTASEPDLYASEAIARPKMYNTWPRSGLTGGTQGARSTSHNIRSHDIFAHDIVSHAAMAPEPDLCKSKAIATPRMYNTWPPRSRRIEGNQATASTSHGILSHAAGNAIGHHGTPDNNAGRQAQQQSPPDPDPLKLAAGLKTESELAQMHSNSSRKRDGFGPITLNKQAHKQARKARQVKKYYEDQNETIERLLKPVSDSYHEGIDEKGSYHWKYLVAVIGSLVVNVILSALQLYASASSVSLSMLATMLNSLFDPVSNLTRMLCNHFVSRVDLRRFPSGNARIETTGNVSFCYLMICVSGIIIAESIRKLAEGSDRETVNFHAPSVVAVGAAFGAKLCLSLYCWTLRNKYSSVRMLWQDHRNDLFINGFGILTSVGGAKIKWWIDPMGSMILSALVTILWARTVFTESQLLIGVSADSNMLQLITYISMTHSTTIKQIDTVRAYHSGPRQIVEVDVIMDPDETLRAMFDTAEELQIKLECLPDVERAYVHIDTIPRRTPQHVIKKVL